MTNEKRFVRVRDKRTRHQFDIDRSRLDDERYELVKNYEDSNYARPAKPHVPLGGPKKTSADSADEGSGPATGGDS